MGTNNYLRVFDRDFVDALLAMTWPEYLRRYKYFGDQWESPEDALTDFFLDTEPEDERLASRIVRSWTLRRTIRCCSPKIFFLEQLLVAVENNPKPRTAGYTVTDGDDKGACEEMNNFGDFMIDAFFERRISDAEFRAAMKLASPVVRSEDCEVARFLQDDAPQVLFSGLPPLSDDDRETALSTVETKRLLRMIEKGCTEGWLRDCTLAAKLWDVSRDRSLKRPVLVWYGE